MTPRIGGIGMRNALTEQDEPIKVLKWILEFRPAARKNAVSYSEVAKSIPKTHLVFKRDMNVLP